MLLGDMRTSPGSNGRCGNGLRTSIANDNLQRYLPAYSQFTTIDSANQMPVSEQRQYAESFRSLIAANAETATCGTVGASQGNESDRLTETHMRQILSV